MNTLCLSLNRHALIMLMLSLAALHGCSVPETQPLERIRHAQDGAYAADISPSGNIIVMSGVSSGIHVWKRGSTTPLFDWQLEGDRENIVTNTHISADERYVITSDRETFAIWNLESGDPEGLWRIDESAIRDVAISNNGRGLLVARSSGKIMFFEPKTSRRLEFLGHTEKVNSIDISPNGRYALSGGNDYVAYLWDTKTGQIVHTFKHDSRISRVAIDDEGRFVFTADSQRESRIWNAQTGELVSSLKFSARQRIFTDVVFSKDGKYLLTGSPSRRMNLWLVDTGEQIGEWKVAPRESSSPPTAVVYGVGFTQEGNIISASSSGLTATWSFSQ